MKRLLTASVTTAKHVDAFVQRRTWLFLVVAGVLLSLGLLIRYWAAPISAGPDIGQFWGFAKLFQTHGLDFYRYADGSDSILPVPGWGFVYPPVWLLILRLALFASPASLATGDMIDISWRLAEKTPIILADIAIALLLLWAIPGSRLKKLGLAGLWLVHPTSWYNSAIFGQFDAIAAAFLLASLAMFVKGWDRLAFALTALATLTKQHAALPGLFMIVAFSHNIPTKRLIQNCLMMGGIAAAASIPFVLGGNLPGYMRSVLLPAQQASYQDPLIYAFSGSGALVTYLHNTFGWDIEHLLVFNSPVLALATITSLFVVYVKRVKVEKAALIGILLFVGIFYRVNYQYLVIYIPLAIYCLATTSNLAERLLSFFLIAIPAVWMWIFDSSFWFWLFTPRTLQVPEILDKLGFTHYVPDYAYVILSTALMAACFAYVAVVLTRRRSPALHEP